MDVAARYRVTDTIEQERGGRIHNNLLRSSTDQGVVVNLAAVSRERFEREIQVITRQRPVLRDDLIDLTGLGLQGVSFRNSATSVLPARRTARSRRSGDSFVPLS